MRIALIVITALAALGGALWFGAAKSAAHEIQALILFLIATVAFSGLAVLRALERRRP
jgi:hypothetical protein